MAALIPAIGTCVSSMTGGERRLAYRLVQKLEDDWLLWYDVPLGPRNVHTDFVVFNSRRGLLVQEVKEWALDTIRDIASELLKPCTSEEDDVPLLTPISAGRHGPKPLPIRLPGHLSERHHFCGEGRYRDIPDHS